MDLEVAAVELVTVVDIFVRLPRFFPYLSITAYDGKICRASRWFVSDCSAGEKAN